MKKNTNWIVKLSDMDLIILYYVTSYYTDDIMRDESTDIDYRIRIHEIRDKAKEEIDRRDIDVVYW